MGFISDDALHYALKLSCSSSMAKQMVERSAAVNNGYRLRQVAMRGDCLEQFVPGHQFMAVVDAFDGHVIK